MDLTSTTTPQNDGPSISNPLKRKRSSTPPNEVVTTLRAFEGSPSIDLVQRNMVLQEELAACQEDLARSREELRIANERSEKERERFQKMTEILNRQIASLKEGRQQTDGL